MADPGSEKKEGAPGVLEACPQDFLVNFSQLRGLFKVFGENKGGGWRAMDPPLRIIVHFH